MKKYLIKTFLLIIIIFTLLSTRYNSVYALNSRDGAEGAASSSGTELDITSRAFSEEFKPRATDSETTDELASPFINTIVQVVNPVLGIIQVIGAILSVASIAFFGFNMILSSTNISSAIFNMPDETPDARAKMMEYLRYLIIGSIFLTTSVTIVRIVFNLFMGN